MWLDEGSDILNEGVGDNDFSFSFFRIGVCKFTKDISYSCNVHTKVASILVMYVYLIGHKSDMYIHTYVGTTENFEERLNEHNNSTLWFPIMVLESTNSLSSKLQTEWLRGKHSVEDRIKHGFKLVRKYCIVAYVAEIELGLLAQMPKGDIKDLSSDFWNTL